MNLDTFFKKFDEFAGAPNAVQKMRELILELAVRGKLTSRGPNDSPVGDLIEVLNKAKIERIKAGDLGDIGRSENSNKPNYPIDVPRYWAWVRLNDIGTLAGGMTPAKAKSVYWDGDIKWFSPKDIKSDELFDSELKITTAGAEATGLQVYPPNCLFIVARSGILKRTFPVAINRVEAAVNQDLKVLIPFIEGMERYLQIMFRGMTDFMLSSLVKTGMTVQSLKYEEFEVQPFPLPPLAEQKRIVAKVDELMALCDRLEAQEAERKEKKRRLSQAAIGRFAEKPTVGNLGLVFHKAYDIEPAELRKVILELAVRGKLVEQYAGDELASITFHKLRPAEKNLGSEFYPEHWLRIALGDLGEWRGGGTPSKNRPDFWEGTIPWVSPKDMKLLQISDSIDHISSTAVNESTAKMIPENSLLMVVRGMILARAFPVAQTTCDVTINQDMKAITPYYPETINFLLLTLRAIEPKILMAIEYSTHGTCKLSTDFLTNFVIGIPPLAEQKRIVAKVNELMALVDALEAQLTNSRALAERLLDATIATVIEKAQRQGAGLVSPWPSVANEELREAFLISRIVSKASDPDYPIGRFRRTKFSYLAHRRAGDDVTKHYIKKAAGPYSPWAKFDGPEDVARARDYVRDTKADPLEGMVVGAHVGEVEEQVADPLIGEAVDWVMKNFHFETNDSLELLTTVDFAAVGLRNEGKEISREAVKKVIARSKDWTAKLKRELFSDENIDKALKRMAGVFPEMYGKA